jgi:hypothetical protein
MSNPLDGRQIVLLERLRQGLDIGCAPLQISWNQLSDGLLHFFIHNNSLFVRPELLYKFSGMMRPPARFLGNWRKTERAARYPLLQSASKRAYRSGRNSILPRHSS